MGCVTSFIYKSEHYEHIIWYSELYDMRFGNIYVKKTQENITGYILKRVQKNEQKKFLDNQKIIDDVFQQFPEFILKIKGFQGHMVKVASSHEEKLKLNEQDNTYMKIEYFEKDLDDDVNVKSLKNRIYDQQEIWNLIYFSIFIFTQLENSKIPIPKIQRKNYLIQNKKLKYYIASLYKGEITTQFLSKEDVRMQYLAKIREFNYNYEHSLISQLEDLLEQSKINMEEKLYDFVSEILIHNKKNFQSFNDLRNYLIFLFPTFHCLFFDPMYISQVQQ